MTVSPAWCRGQFTIAVGVPRNGRIDILRELADGARKILSGLRVQPQTGPSGRPRLPSRQRS